MLRRPETQDLVFSTQIGNACSASSAKRSRFTQRKATKTLLNTSFRQWQFATLCRSNSDPDDYVDLLCNCGIALRQLKRPTDALASYDKALALKPDHAEALCDRGKALRELKRPVDELASYDEALALKPDYVEALCNRGNALVDLKRSADALASYDKALALKPDYVDALCNRGNALRDLNRPADALASYDKALALKPDYVEALGAAQPTESAKNSGHYHPSRAPIPKD